MLCLMRLLRTILFSFALLGLPASAALAETGPTRPVNNNGHKWRIAYLEGGNFQDYQTIFLKIVAGLIELGWIEPMPLPEAYDPDHGRIWAWVAERVRSDYVEFVPDGFYSSSFKDDLRRQTRRELLRRLNEDQDINLILAMGTWAGQDLATDEHAVPTVVASTSDPLRSGIIRSVEDSGLDHLHAKVEPGRYAHQLRLFHDTIGFKSLGVVHEDSLEGRTFAALDEVELVAAERGFAVQRCIARNNEVSLALAFAETSACYDEFAPRVEAMYVTVHRGEAQENLPNLLKPLLANRVATFAMGGSEFVKRGVLLSISQEAEFTQVGRFHAGIIARIFNGAMPRDLVQRFSPPNLISINLKTAEIIGFIPPFEILATADEVYKTIPEH